MKWHYNIFELVKHVIPHFLMTSGPSTTWVTSGLQNWITGAGQAWGNNVSLRHKEWIQSLLRPLQSLHDTFYTYLVNTFYKLHITGQVIYLEHYLNDLFDPVERRIYINDGSLVLPPFLYLSIDDQPPLYLYLNSDGGDPFYLYNNIDYSGQVLFIIYFPDAIPVTNVLEIQVGNSINHYRRAGSIYELQNYTV